MDRESRDDAASQASLAASIASHLVATTIYLSIFLAIPALLLGMTVVLLMIGGLLTGDPGGALFLPAVFIFGALYALCVVVLQPIFCATTFGIEFVRRRISIPGWIPIVLVFPVVYAVIESLQVHSVFLSIVLSAAFVTYWLAYLASDAILKWVRKRWRGWLAWPSTAVLNSSESSEDRAPVR